MRKKLRNRDVFDLKFYGFQTVSIKKNNSRSFMEYKMDSQVDMSQYGKTRKSWSKEEDDILIRCIHAYGIGHWSTISQSLQEQTGTKRTTKQCRNRWMNSLDPSVNHQDWTPEEEQTIYNLQKQLGNKWADIAKRLNGR